jgi:hypothetical protein
LEQLEDRTVPSFLAPVNYDIGPGTFNLTVGDFNGDGLLDLLTTTTSGDTTSLAVLLNNGDGTFQPPVRSGPIGRFFYTVADLTGNGLSDVVASAPDGNVAAFLSNGDGTFQPPLEIPNTNQVTVMAVGDLNGDGIPDLVTRGGAGVNVYMGNGDGTFRALASYTLPVGGPVRGVIADFTGDGIPDLLVVDTGDSRHGEPPGVNVLVGNGDGTFQSPVRTPDRLAGSCRYLVAADLRNDNVADLVFVDVNSEHLYVQLNNGDGTFQDPVQVFADPAIGRVTVVDVNGDGIPDVLVPHAGGLVHVLLGNGDGTFQFGPDRFVGTDLSEFGETVFAHFNGDGNLDLATIVGAYTPSSVGVRFANPDGTFQTTPTYPAGPLPGGFVLGDFNNDGIPDLAMIDNLPMGTVRVFQGNGDGTFAAPQIFSVGPNSVNMTSGYFDRSGNLDLAVVTSAGVDILLGNGDGTFQPAGTYATGVNPLGVAVGDFTGDGNFDLAVVNGRTSDSYNGSVSILLGNGDGTFQPARNMALGDWPYAIAVGDFRGDGHMDLAVVNHIGRGVTVFLGNGDGTFQPGQRYTVGNNPRAVKVGDFTGSGRDDLVVANDDANTVSVLLSNPDGSFQMAMNYTAGIVPEALVVADLTGSGRLDIAVVVQEGVYVLAGQGDGSFQVPNIAYSTASWLSGSIAAGDLTGDNFEDLVVATNSFGDGTFTVLLNAGGSSPHGYRNRS